MEQSRSWLHTRLTCARRSCLFPDPLNPLPRFLESIIVFSFELTDLAVIRIDWDLILIVDLEQC